MVGNLEGDRYYDLDLGQVIRTHVLDISTMFKTPAESGTLWMTNNPINSDYIKVFMEDGELNVEANVNQVSIFFINSSKWCRNKISLLAFTS